jgi:hypothetical protein
MHDTQFQVDQALIDSARVAFQRLPNLFWLVGSACTGKSTIAHAIAAHTGIAVYDMDAHIYGSYMPRYNAQQHPANAAWLAAANPLQWMLALPWAEFDAHNAATTAEYLALLVEDLQHHPPETPLLVDGGITHPALLAQVLPPSHIVCMTTTPAIRLQTWEADPARAEMKGWVQSLPDGAAMWARFLAYDQRMDATMVRESQQLAIRTFLRDGETPSSLLADLVRGHWGL